MYSQIGNEAVVLSGILIWKATAGPAAMVIPAAPQRPMLRNLHILIGATSKHTGERQPCRRLLRKERDREAERVENGTHRSPAWQPSIEPQSRETPRCRLRRSDSRLLFRSSLSPQFYRPGPPFHSELRSNSEGVHNCSEVERWPRECTTFRGVMQPLLMRGSGFEIVLCRMSLQTTGYLQSPPLADAVHF